MFATSPSVPASKILSDPRGLREFYCGYRPADNKWYHKHDMGVGILTVNVGSSSLKLGVFHDANTANASGAMFLQAQGNIRQITFEYNLFDGGGWNFTLGDYSANTYDDIFVNDNRFNPTGYGTAVRGGVAPDLWTNNYRLGALPPNYAGAVVPMP